MYNDLPYDYDTIINSNIRTVGINIQITLADQTRLRLLDRDVLQNSLYINSRCVSGDDIELGSTYASELGVSIRYHGDVTKLKKAIVVPHFLLYHDGVTHIPLGVFRVDDVSLNGNYVKIICLDDMVRFNKRLSTNDMTLHDSSRGTCGMIKRIGEYIIFCCEKCGVPTGFNSSSFDDFPNGNISLGITMNEHELYTYRDVLEAALELMGAFGVIDRLGYFKVSRFGKTPVSVSTPYTRCRLTSNNYAIDSLRVFYKGIMTSSSGEQSTYPIDLSNNKILATYEQQNYSQYGNIVDCLMAINELSINDLSFSPCTIEYNGDPAIDVGDMIEVKPTIGSLHRYTYEGLESFTFNELEQMRYGELSDYYLSDSYNAIVMQHNWVYRGKSTIYCYGKSAELRKIFV